MSKDLLKENTIIQIPFYDVDSMHIAWHGNCVKYLEDARCNLLEKLGYDYEQMKNSGYAWPVVNLNIKYIKPFTFKQKIRVEAELVEYENCIKINYLIFDDKTNEKLTKAQTTQVAVELKTNELCYISPKALIDKVEELS